MYKLFSSHNQNLYLVGLLSVIADFFFLSQQFITWGAIAVRAYRRNYVWSIDTLTFLCSYPTQRTTKELNP